MINPHLKIYVRGEGKLCGGDCPRVEPELQELRHTINLGNYTVEELTELIEEIHDAVNGWISKHPPHEE